MAKATKKESGKTKGKASRNLTGGTGNNEWYTPPEYVELARRVMGSIDTDPASNATAQEWIKATTYYTEETNGLVHNWNGNVWINPPYSKALIGAFCEKLLQEWQSGHMKQAVILVNNATDTKWFQGLIAEASAVCFTRGRIRFLKGTSCRNSPTQGQAFIYFGDRVPEFAGEFKSVGTVFVPYRG